MRGMTGMAKADFDIRLYDSMTRQKQVLKPIKPDHPRLYVCGPTVYDRIHIGNARPLVVFDVLYRLLRYRYGEKNVTYARNITDIDDKIIARAHEAGVESKTLAEKQTKQFHRDCKTLGILPPTYEPRATDHIGDMVKLIESLIAKKHAYVAEGHVLFDVTSFADYGNLSGRSVDDMKAGARVEVAPHKKNPMDFVLWKPSKAAEPYWDSPWSTGRPGWHIECSSMAEALLGVPFDIHGGGIDLMFPHHENEIAQSRCAHGCEALAQIWMHNGYVNMEGEKMAKSKGNVLTVRKVLAETQGRKKAWGDVMRFALLNTHYAKSLDYSKASFLEAESVLKNWRKIVKGIRKQKSIAPDMEFVQLLADNLNTHEALMRLDALAKKAEYDNDAARTLKRSAELLGMLEEPYWKVDEARMSKREIKEKIKKRDDARKRGRFEEADAIRDELSKAGVVVEDKPEGSDSRKITQREKEKS
ncbi:MAG: cysteine--tRNA ligase [Proteobacteria bacterium]|nr:cysteine--tRNA ligase [Pseudomonadota bacterium]